MRVKLLNRREVMSAQYEQTDRYRAMQELKQLGVAKDFNQLQLYHGRAGDGRYDWEVDPSFDNADNNTGHYNINKKTALNTSDYETASHFAIERSNEDMTASAAEVYRIMSNDPDAVVLDEMVLSKLDDTQMGVVRKAIGKTLLSVTDGSPLSFDDRDVFEHHRLEDFVNNEGKLYDDEVEKVSQKLGLRPEVVLQIGSALNTVYCLQHGYLRELCTAFLDNQSMLMDDKMVGRTITMNHEYLANWFRENHIVGYRKKVQSATLGQVIENSVLFDLEKINTEEKLSHEAKERHRRFGKIAYQIYNDDNKYRRGDLVEYLSGNLYAKPKEIVEMAKRTPGYKEIFESDAGNWEKYKLEEHTETVLELFDKNYADLLPASVLPVMRLALLVHDIGKPISVKRGDKANQKQYNLDYADHFLRENRVNEPTIQLIKTMIGDGMDLTTGWMVERDKNAGEQLGVFCENVIKKYLETDYVGKETVLGFRNMLEVLQICDSAAYTTMAITRKSGGSGARYRNAGSFDDSFDEYRGMTGRRVRMR